ncbi:hypothetical protein PRIPAC_78303 [Pristionchus pacificus]|uniref:G protein-coupled receptor n=1 Tax=Pristionchus pacificus TaxID=54126 RepID=A0A2A6CN03_PRIPA|nr:hypothetical protein PRIPAC_78303 [Pristionchus pacificus]|eukprot:PDM79476.1 G protein-coupled receptor [Pristionchus pacificus]
MIKASAIIQDFHYYAAVAGVFLNMLLLYVISRFTKSHFGAYKQLLTVFAAYDVFLTILHATVPPRVLIVGTTFGVVCTYENRIVTGIFCSCFTVPFALMIIHFLYRYWSVLLDSHVVAGIILNIILLYAIRRFTKKALGSYKQLLTIFAIFDMYLCTLHAVVKPRVTSFYASCFTVPFALMNIHFLYRFWSIRRPDLLHLFSNNKFIAFLCIFPIGEFIIWYLLCYYVITGEGDEIGKERVTEEYNRRFGRILTGGWLMMDFWENDEFNPRLFFAMCSFDTIMIVSFSIASTLGGFTFYYIRRADTISTQALNMQFKLFIAVCAQTFVPLVFVYIPYFCVITFPFFHLPIAFLDTGCMLLTSCFPAWDAVIMILLMKDYREGLFGMFKKKPPPAATTVWKTNTSMIPSGAYPSTIASSVMERSFALPSVASPSLQHDPGEQPRGILRTTNNTSTNIDASSIAPSPMTDQSFALPSYEIEDRLNVRGPKLPWGPVTVKRGKTWKDGHAAIFVSGGDMKEMEMEKEKYETGELKPPRSNTKRKPLFDIVPPCQDLPLDDDDDEEMDEDEPMAKRPVRGAVLRAVKMEREDSLPPAPLPAKKAARDRANSLPPIKKAISSSISSNHPPTVSTTRTAPKATVPVPAAASSFSAQSNRLEDKVRDIYNDTVGIRHESKSLVQCTKQTAAKTDGLSTAVDKLRDQLPPPPIAPQYGMYEGLTEQAVAALDCREDSILVFAGKLDRALFKRTSRPHQERDQVRLQWLIEVVLHRRRCSVGDQIKYWKSAILQRINLNASREDPTSTSGAPYTPPVLLSSSRVINHSTSRSFHPQPTSSQFSATPSHSTSSHFRATPSNSHGHFMANSSHNQPRIPMRQQGVTFRNRYDPDFDPDNFVGSRPNQLEIGFHLVVRL